MGLDIVEIHVGKGEKSRMFRVHEKILRDKIPYINDMLSNNSKEAVEKKIEFPDDAPEDFDVLLLWVYHDKLPQLKLICTESDDSNYEENWEPNFFYALAYKLRLTTLMDVVVDFYIDESISHGLTPSPLKMADIFSSIPEGMNFREYFVYWFHYVMHGMPRTSLFLQNIEIDDLAASLQNKDFVSKYFELVKQHPIGKPAPNPSVMPRCMFHQHSVDEPCPTKKSKKRTRQEV